MSAAASLLTVHAVGKAINTLMAMDGLAMQHLIGMELGPTRLKCALLPLQALQQGLTVC